MKFQYLKKQRGITLWGFVWSVVLFIIPSYLIIISIPPYLNNMKLQRALNAVAQEPDVLIMRRSQMLKLLTRKLIIDSADEVVNLKKVFKVKLVNNKKELSIDYEVVIPIFYNASLLFDFKNHVLAPAN